MENGLPIENIYLEYTLEEREEKAVLFILPDTETLGSL